VKRKRRFLAYSNRINQASGSSDPEERQKE